MPSSTQEGAVQKLAGVEAPPSAKPSEPVLALQEKESAALWGSLASTSKWSTSPGAAVVDEAEAERMTGGEGDGTGAPWVMHRATLPVVCPPRPSETITERRQLLQAAVGSAEGVNWGEREEALDQEPAQEALQE
jgi:hypothetical protein